jgi:hypothetical protein
MWIPLAFENLLFSNISIALCNVFNVSEFMQPWHWTADPGDRAV